MKYPNGALISATKAAVRLGVGRKTVVRHLSTTRIGRRVLVRVADVEAKIGEAAAKQPDLMILHSTAADIAYRLRRDFEKGGLRGHVVPMISLIGSYWAEFPGRPLIPAEDEVTGLAPHFIQWLKLNPPPGGGDDGEELRDWISNYPIQ
ncbi:hypothetical protein [Methylobacterium trifolii]|uniref:Helix-turn-helix domain-containing protein n=1 Tax=Methylobacterium trifolii TaxID=1003092 RepID=A0ABQ4U4M9_9HYPH|nr:hypothetical protein [Methylobacterium trifolii]GJE62064.1 hypothetical protein MPOCJGCO_4193 [Methylobacterium trifolii]